MVGGFLFGVVHAEGGSSLASIPGRIFVGMVFSLLNQNFLGFPPVDAGGGSFYNTWPYVGTVLVFHLPVALVAYVDLTRRFDPETTPEDKNAATIKVPPDDPDE